MNRATPSGTATPLLRLFALTTVLVSSVTAASAQDLRLVGRTDLGGQGLNGGVAVVGTTAIVAAGVMPAAGVHAHLYNPYDCRAVALKLVDISDPLRPRLVGRIPLPEGVAANDVAAARVATPAFTGDLAAVALSLCGGDGAYQERGIAYYDITDPAAPLLLGRYAADADIAREDSVPPCGPPPTGSAARCASSQHTVQLVERHDGRVLSLSTEPGASASLFPSGDLRIVDVTDPRHPAQIGSYPDPAEPIFSSNGCRPFRAAHDARSTPDGTGVLLAFYDGGMISLDLRNPAAPTRMGLFAFPRDPAVEGNAGYVATGLVEGRPLALLSEQDWIAPTTTLRVDTGDPAAAVVRACQAVFTLFDPADEAQLYRRPERSVAAPLAYLGRGCPAPGPGGGGHMADMHDPAAGPDPYLDDPHGRIALLDRARQETQPAIGAGSGCTMAARALRAQEAGARAVVIAQTAVSAPEPFSPDGDPAGLRIPIVQIGREDGDRLRAARCPAVENGRCASAPSVTATLQDGPGEWGGILVLDMSDPARPREIARLHSPSAAIFPPPDLGVYAPNRPTIDAGLAFVPWNSDGVRVLDLSTDEPVDVASFVPPDVPDPTGQLPAKSFVMGVALVHTAGADAPATHLLVSDMNYGLYVLEIVR